MRPVNLIPGSQRKGNHAALREGWLSYAVIAGLVLVLGAVVALVLTGNKIADHKSEIADLQQRQAVAEQRAAQLAPYVDFANLEQTRRDTVASLAQSRFDWERVLRELAIVIPGDVWLTSLSGSVGGGASSATTPTSGGGASTLSTGVTGPSLTIMGCATSQTAVASFLASLRDIDGVTRVGLQSSLRSDAVSSSGGGSASSGGGACSGTRPLESFQALATFDSVQVPSLDTESTTTTAPAAPAGTTTTSTTSTAPTTSTTSTTSTTPTTTTPAPTAPPTATTSDASAASTGGGSN